SLHRRYLERLERRFEGRTRRVLPQLTYHAAEADLAEKVVEYGSALALQALDAVAGEDAVRAARQVLDFVDEDDGPSAEADVRQMLGAGLRLMRDTTGAIREY